MKLKIKQGTTSKLIRIFAQDSAATDGSGKTGIAHNASGLTAYYLPEGDAAPTAITLYSGTVGTYSSGCWSEVDATNMPGIYEIGLPDAAIDATSEGSVVVMIKGASDMAPILLEIELDAVDYKSSADFGLSNLDATITSRSTLTASQVNTEVDTALSDYDAPTKAELDTAVSLLATSAEVATVDSVADSILVIANRLDSAMEADGSVSRFTTNALEQAPSGGGGDATASNQSTIITHLTDIKGSGFASTDTLEAIRDRGDSAWTTGGSGGGIYSLTVTCEDSSGSAVANVRVNIDGTTTTQVTNSSGQCVFNLDAGTYSLVASPPSEFNTPADTSVTVSADASQTITLTQASTSGSAGWVG